MVSSSPTTTYGFRLLPLWRPSLAGPVLARATVLHKYKKHDPTRRENRNWKTTERKIGTITFGRKQRRFLGNAEVMANTMSI